jgi:isoleucyl-tRNA synthetase
MTADADMDPLDRHALDMVGRAHREIQAAYATYEFHKVFHTLHNLCAADLSAFYLDVIKDRLYASAPRSRERRSAQTALYRILCILAADMAPVLSFTAEEVFDSLPAGLKPEVATVFAFHIDESSILVLDDEEAARRQTLLDVRSEITRAIEPLRKAGQVGHALDTAVIVYAGSALTRDLHALGTDLRAAFLVSDFTLEPLEKAPVDAVRAENMDDLRIHVCPAAGKKCVRCWIYSKELGSDPAHPELCPRCTAVLREIGD